MRKPYVRTVKLAEIKPCPVCKKPFKVRKHGKDGASMFCSIPCANVCRSKFSPVKIYPTGKEHRRWKGGRSIGRQGYILITVPDRPKMVFEHRYKMEKKLKRKLETYEWVHHKNGNRQDNRLSNLLIVTHANHRSIVACPKCLFTFGIH